MADLTVRARAIYESASAARPASSPARSSSTTGSTHEYFSGDKRMAEHIELEDRYLNSTRRSNVQYVPRVTITPQQIATMSFIDNEMAKIYALANKPDLPMYSDSTPYGMTGSWSLFTGGYDFSPYVPGMFSTPVTYAPQVVCGRASNPFVFSSLGPRTGVSVGATINPAGLGTLVSAPLGAVGNALSGIGDALLDASGWSISI